MAKVRFWEDDWCSGKAFIDIPLPTDLMLWFAPNAYWVTVQGNMGRLYEMLEPMVQNPYG